MPPGFDRLESFGHDKLTAKHRYFRCSRPPDVDGIKIFDKRWPGCKTLRHWPPIWFHIFFSKACLVLSHPFLHLGCLIRFQFYKGQYCAQYHGNSIVDFHVVYEYSSSTNRKHVKLILVPYHTLYWTNEKFNVTVKLLWH